MKKVFLVFGIAAFSSAAAQQNDVFNIEDYLRKKNADDKAQGPGIKNPFSDPGLFKNQMAEQLLSMANNNPYIVPQDGSMPCIKPDMRQFNTMPNPGLGVLRSFPKVGEIPNGAFPYRTYLLSK
jgi:hypothetical protein